MKAGIITIIADTAQNTVPGRLSEWLTAAGYEHELYLLRSSWKPRLIPDMFIFWDGIEKTNIALPDHWDTKLPFICLDREHIFPEYRKGNEMRHWREGMLQVPKDYVTMEEQTRRLLIEKIDELMRLRMMRKRIGVEKE